MIAPAEYFPHAARVTVAMPGAVSLRPALAAGTKARIRYLLSSDYRKGLLVRSATVRRGVPVLLIERVCLLEVSTLRRPPGACRS